MIRGIEHIGLAVESIERAKRLWEVLGLEVKVVEEIPEEGVRVALIPCGATNIELLEATRPDSPIARFLARRGEGIHHLCVGTDAIANDDLRLREAGFEVLREKPTRGAGGCWVQFVHPSSTGGVLLELSEPAERG